MAVPTTNGIAGIPQTVTWEIELAADVIESTYKLVAPAGGCFGGWTPAIGRYWPVGPVIGDVGSGGG